MLDLLFDLPAAAQLLCFIVYGGVVLAVSLVILSTLHARYVRNPKLLPVGPAFQVLTVLFALLLGFLAADIWAQQRQAVDAAFKEGVSLQRLRDLAGPTALDTADASPMLAQYQMAVTGREWGLNFNHAADPAAAAAINALRLHGAQLARDGKPAVLAAEWMRSVNDLEEARYRRLLIGSDATDNSQWAIVLLLTFFAAAALAACHMDRPPAGRLILALFCLGVAIVLWQLARHTNPYNGGNIRISMPASLAPPAEAVIRP
ncbi:bestrophin-like domain [Variovorax sp. PAMC 28711]|uniref:bestrophin-like domain n=1 Tax=Variovorax sp. PAMC 28711 TaxID=1795631 RepID=UPI00078D18F8|nr:DUF4239 domain-containing protein [Variovorax sp. PAMC 28711]AMM24989.1 hypothetical protein AX767_11915 [Variovorax sp. PAMC 28711]